MHEVKVNRLGGLSLPRKSVVRLTDHPDMTLDVYRGRKTTMQQQSTPLPPLLPPSFVKCNVFGVFNRIGMVTASLVVVVVVLRPW